MAAVGSRFDAGERKPGPGRAHLTGFGADPMGRESRPGTPSTPHMCIAVLLFAHHHALTDRIDEGGFGACRLERVLGQES
jgi:hypothetical protein